MTSFLSFFILFFVSFSTSLHYNPKTKPMKKLFLFFAFLLSLFTAQAASITLLEAQSLKKISIQANGRLH